MVKPKNCWVGVKQHSPLVIVTWCVNKQYMYIRFIHDLIVHVLKSSVNTPVMLYTLSYDKYIQMYFASPTLYKYFVERCFNRGFKTLMLWY